MIWESKTLMTLIDLMIVFATVASLWFLPRQRQRIARGDLVLGASIVVTGLLLIGLLYLADLLIMWLLPFVASQSAAMRVMEELHLNYSWPVMLVATVCIFVGSVRSHRDLLSLIDRLEESEKTLDHELSEHRSTAAALHPTKALSKVFDRVTGDSVGPAQLKTYAEVLAQLPIQDRLANGVGFLYSFVG